MSSNKENKIKCTFTLSATAYKMLEELSINSCRNKSQMLEYLIIKEYSSITNTKKK